MASFGGSLVPFNLSLTPFIELTFLELIVIVITQAAIAAIIIYIIRRAYLKKFEHIKITGPLIMWRSQKGLKTLDSIAKKWPRFWAAYGDLGVVLAFGFVGAMYLMKEKPLLKRVAWSLLSTAFLFLLIPPFNPLLPNSLYPALGAIMFFFGFSGWLSSILGVMTFSLISDFLLGNPLSAGAAPAIPGVKIQGSPFTIPWYGWLTFPIFMIVHEACHGILSRLAGIKVKNAGLMMLGFFPMGAFVEPDEEEINKASTRDKLRVFAAGSMANYCLALLIVIFFFFFAPVLQATGFNDAIQPERPLIVGLAPGYDACEKMSPHLGDGIVLEAVNGTQVVEVQDAVDAISANVNGSAVLLETDKGDFAVKPKDGMVGISSLVQSWKPLPVSFEIIMLSINFLYILMLFSTLIGIMNLLPMFILDGGLMFETILEERFGKRKAGLIFMFVGALLLLFLLANISPLFFVGSAAPTCMP